MNRRSPITGMLAAAAATMPGRELLAHSQPSADLAGCMTEPGIALFLNLLQGQPVMSPQELLPGADWQVFASPSTPVSFLYPPDWSGQDFFASTFSQNAAPQWTAQQQSISGIVSARVLSPDSTALWEYAVGTLQGVALTVDQAVAIAEGGVLGDGVAGGNRLCAHTETTLNGGTAWLTAVESNGSILLTNGTLYADASGFAPYSVLTSFGRGGSRDRFEPLMRQVFLPIQFQLLQGGGSDPTPTPTP